MSKLGAVVFIFIVFLFLGIVWNAISPGELSRATVRTGTPAPTLTIRGPATAVPLPTPVIRCTPVSSSGMQQPPNRREQCVTPTR